MKLVDATIENYRCFRHFDIDFDPRLTVIVGTNGAGKTTLLEAVALLLQRIIHDVAMSPTHKIPLQDIMVGEDETSVAGSFSVPNSDAPLRMLLRYRNQGKDATAKLEERKGENPLQDFYKKVFEGRATIPVLAYYHAERSLNTGNTQVSGEKKTAFANALGSSIDYAASCAWFMAKSSEEAIKARNTRDINYTIPELDAVRDAIAQALGEYNPPYVDNTPAEVLITSRKNPEQVLRLNQLSAGYHTMLALVMDLARRMAVANEGRQLEGPSVLHSPGIVLIDEVEVHLHPKWQQDVLPRLLQIFPNVQFIVTTHSAPVVTSIKAGQLRILDNGSAIPATGPTYGAEAGAVLQDIFGTSPRPDNEITQKLRSYLELVSAGKGQTDEGESLKSQLLQEMPHDPDLVRANRLQVLAELRNNGRV